MSHYVLRRSVWWLRRRFSFLPLLRRNGSENYTDCPIASLIPRDGRRFPLVLSLPLWPKLRILPFQTLGLRVSRYLHFQDEGRIQMPDFSALYVQCVVMWI